ncbi:tetratricopeptide repeat protein [Kovacikia minuta CCNUW1]|uniref:tetratricopeptide repeat protein n=1 Tax=Kovacikia minuta TaxID=2931930 RepID=UPI001CCD3AB3|nr:tetratricopeptide repeat protein [Kovacikia minuta]UBF25366.1 tetratricopeptide repeat protein [Kovacikia minuta CCNUW1]
MTAIDPQPDVFEADNRRNLRRLVLALQASLNQLNLLIGICDNLGLRDELIQAYETEFSTQGVACYRLELTREQISLRQAMAELVNRETPLQLGQPAIVTVLGADRLLAVRLQDAQSDRERFFFSLQWTREALREFQVPIVLWLTEKIAAELTLQAPDFWSWRGGVFEFERPLTVQPIEQSNPIPDREIQHTRHLVSSLESQNQAKELQKQIAALEVEDAESPLLASLYVQLGKLYGDRLKAGTFADYAQEQDLAIQAYQKAIALQETQDLQTKLATSLNELALLYQSQGRYGDAEPLFLRALEIDEQQLGVNHPTVAIHLNNLANLYKSQGRYGDAEPLFLRALEISEQQLGPNHSDVAIDLNNLANLYQSQGRYGKAETLFLRALEIDEQHLGANHPAVAIDLNNLANLYQSQGRYGEAEPLFLRSVEIDEQQLGANHPTIATCLNNLAYLYRSQGRYAEAEPLFLRALEIDEQQLGTDHPDIAIDLNNLALLYKSQGRDAEAESLFLKAWSISQQRLGVDHPQTITVRENLESLRREQQHTP